MAKYTLTKSYGKWSDGYSKGSVSNTRYGNSSFWMDDDIMSSFESKADGGIDSIKLASYLRAIANFVRILTKDDKVKVKFSTKGNSYTDGKTVTITSKIDTGDFDTTVGLALHEAAHCVLTDFNAVSRHMEDPTGKSMTGRATKFEAYADAKMFKDLCNIIEDRRIDYYVMTQAPGYYGYYKALYDTYFNAKVIDQALETNQWCTETEENYINHICNFTNPNRQLDSLKALRKIWAVVNIGSINRLKTTADVCQVAEQVFDLIKAATAKPEKKKDEEEGDGKVDPNAEREGNPGAGSSGEKEENESGNGIQMEGEGDDSDEGDAPINTPTKELSEGQKSRLKKAIEHQRDFTNGKVKKKSMKDKDAERVEQVAESSTSLVEVNTGMTKAEVVVIKGMDDKILNNHDLVGSQYRDWNHSWNNDNDRAIEQGWQLGTMLGRKLKTRDEDRVLKTTRLDAGAIDKRLIAELGFGNDKIFTQTIVKTTRNSTVHISLDASGSMHGSKWEKALKTAVAIARACSMVSSIRCVIDVRGQTNGYRDSRPLVWVVYDSKKDSTSILRTKFKGLHPGGSTPEGLCFDALMKEIIGESKGTDAFFINVSDGEPCWTNYSGQHAEQHTKRLMDKMRGNKINVLSYFATTYSKERMMNSHSFISFKNMYGKDAQCIDVEDFNQLSKSINQLFVRSID